MVEMEVVQEPQISMEILSEMVSAPYEQGVEDGKRAERDRFWDEYQANGARVYYNYAFAGDTSGGGWTFERLMGMKYPCRPTNATGIFYLLGQKQSAGTIDYRRFADKLDFSNTGDVSYSFMSAAMDHITVDFSNVHTMNYAFNGAYGNYITSLALKVTERLAYAVGAFTYASNLENLTFTDGSIIACSGFDFSHATKLTHDSLMSVINALKSGVTSRTLTLGATNLAKLTDAEKAAATQKGWTLA